MIKKTKQKYFSHDANARNDIKLVNLRLKLDFAGCIVFWWILELLFDANDYKLPTNYAAISLILNVETELVRSVVEDFDLFVLDEKRGFFYSKSFNRRMKLINSKSEKCSIAGKKGNEIRWRKETKFLQTSQSTREAERMKSVYGEEVEQDPLRNKTTKYKV